MFKVRYVAFKGKRNASEENGAHGFKSGFKLAL